MKPILLLSILSVLSAPLVGAEKIGLLTLKDGTVYKGVEITGVSAKGVRIIHSSGAANVPVDQLPDKLADKYRKAQEEASAADAAKKEAPSDVPVPTIPKKQQPPDVPGAGKKTEIPPAPPAQADRVPQLVTGKIYGLAEVMADLHDLEGKIVKVEVIANTASKIESLGRGEYQIFVGDISEKSDYVFMGFPEEGRKKIETLLRGKRGKMTFYIEVRPDDNPKLQAVGRTTVSGAPGKPVIIKW